MSLRDKNGLTEAEFLASYRVEEYPRPSVACDKIGRASCRDRVFSHV